MTGLYIILGVVVFLCLIAVFYYNRIISLKNITEQSFGDVDVQLKQRFNLIPNLVETVKSYAKHEESTLTKLTEARTNFMNASTQEEKIESENMLSGTLKSLFAVSENYPDLKANTNFLELQRELSDIENKISSARRFFNSSVQEFNTIIEQFPGNIFSNMFGFKKKKMFEITNEVEKENVKVSF